jgi:hypothetical protein
MARAVIVKGLDGRREEACTTTRGKGKAKRVDFKELPTNTNSPISVPRATTIIARKNLLMPRPRPNSLLFEKALISPSVCYVLAQ